jgi:hypothetical protein
LPCCAALKIEPQAICGRWANHAVALAETVHCNS